jgi:hypothetical protein
MSGSPEAPLDVSQLRNVQMILRPSGTLFHRDEVVNGRHVKCALLEGDGHGPGTEVLELVALAHEQVDLDRAIRRSEIQRQHVLFTAPSADLLDVADAIPGFRDPRARTQLPEQIDCCRPGLRGQAGHEVQIEGHPRPTVEHGRDTSDNHEVNVTIVKLVQNLVKVARHADAAR